MKYNFLRPILCLMGICLFVNFAVAEASRIRLMVPMSEQGEFEEFDPLETSGFGLAYVFESGLGVGFTSRTTTSQFEQEVSGITFEADVSVDAQFVDVSYTFGEDFTFTIGVGLVVGGETTLDVTLSAGGVSVSNTAMESTNGSAVFLGFGITFDSVELLAEYRQNTLNIATDDDLGTDDSITTAQLGVGVGFVF